MVQRMSVSNSIAPHLPFLRRFARALTGSQAEGDACVVATLEDLVKNVDAEHMAARPRMALYQKFLKVWSAMPAHALAPPETPAEQHLRALTPEARQAFLLLSVEGFTSRDVAEIMGMSEENVALLVQMIGREIATEVATDVLIIEDEPLIAMYLREIIEELGHRHAGTAHTHGEAVALFESKRPGLILTDVQLADGSSGLDAVNEILTAFDVPVIFLTAYPERLLTGERPEPTFLITKPFEPAVVRSLVSQALFFGTKAHAARRIKNH
jgi:CheY-like chemotaxis protein